MNPPPTPQPLSSSDSSTLVIFNGEIYNSEEFSPPSLSDGHSLLAAYHKLGPSFPQHLDGEFSLVLFDYAKSLLIVASDTFGTKPLFASITPTHAVIASYRSAASRALSALSLPHTSLVHFPPNTIQVYSYSPSSSPENIFSLQSTLPTHTFSLSQHKTSYADFSAALHAAVAKRARNLETDPFVGLSSGYDSGCLACLLANHSVPAHAFTVSAAENAEIVSERLGYMAARSALLTNSTHLWSRASLKAQRASLSSLAEPYSYPVTIGYLPDPIDAPLPMIGDPAAVGLSVLCEQARAVSSRPSLVYMSGSGADEIISDYGFRGVKYSRQSHFGGVFPDDLEPHFPWPNFFEGSQRAYLMKEELIAGSYGIEARYPFLDPAVVQEFLSLVPALKNDEYKGAIAHVMREIGCPYDSGKKVGFSETDDKGFLADSPPPAPLPPLPEPKTPPPSCPPLDIKGIIAYATSPAQASSALSSLTALFPGCSDLPLKHATHLLESKLDKTAPHPHYSTPLPPEELYVEAAECQRTVEQKQVLLRLSAVTLFNEKKLAASIKLFNRVAEVTEEEPSELSLLALRDMYATYSLNFISNSPVFYTIRYPDYKPTLLANNEFEKSIALLTALLSNPDSPPTMRELNAYALAALHHDAGNSDAATRTLQEFIFSSPPDPQPLPQQKLQPFQFQAGGKTPLRVATVATSPRAELDDLIHTGLKAGVEVDVLGLGMEWGGTHTKMELYYEYVKRLDPTQLVMTVDAYDVILSPELLSIVDKVPDGTIIFNGEYTCWPDESAAPLIPAGGPLKYLNSGVIVGQAGKMMKMLEEVLTYPALFDDQRAFLRYYLQNQEFVRVDTEGVIFYTLHAVKGGVVYDHDGYVTQPMGEGDYRRPLVLHGNALDGKALFAEIMEVVRKEDEGLVGQVRLGLDENGGNGARVRHLGRRLMERMVEGGGVGEGEWWTFAAAANELFEHGWYCDGAKLLFGLWKVDGGGELSGLMMKTYATWFIGEGCVFCKAPPLRDSKEAFRLVDLLRSWAEGKGYARYAMGTMGQAQVAQWKEVSTYNLAVAEHWLGNTEGSEAAYAALIGAEVEVERGVKGGGEGEREGGRGDSLKPLSDLRIAAVATEDRVELQNLLKSAEFVGVEVDVLGMNDEYSGNAQKVGYFLDYVSGVQDDQLVLFVDAYDILLFDTVRELAGLWKRGELCGGEFAEIIFSAEKSSYPDLGIAGLYGEKWGLYRYLNSGAILGSAAALRSMLEEVASYPGLLVSDQRSFVRWFLKHRGEEKRVCLNTDGSAFFSLHSVNSASVIGDDGQFENPGAVPGGRPGVVHGNAGGGGGKKYYAELFETMERVRGGGAGGVVKTPKYAMAVTLYKEGRTQESVAAFLEHLEDEPEHAVSYYNLGVVMGELGDWGRSIGYYRKCLEAGGDSVEAEACMSNLAMSLMVGGGGEGAGEEAVELLERVEEVGSPEWAERAKAALAQLRGGAGREEL